ncbi:hypothetical protein [Neisseria sp. Ec49-e6-T10]|uniref:hypothetical protein n=1 Tax=Neisseria sp. Ec49-e6-T10 TaxID=3140744 RepID=UPI003EC146DA
MMKTLYIVQSFTAQKKGKTTELIADTPIQCGSAEEAKNRAERFADKRAGEVPSGILERD